MNKDINLSHLPVIDWDLATKLAGHHKEIAEELLALLVKTLPDDIKKIKEFYVAQKYPELLKQVHKLHGALCYCGLPRLKTLIACLETDLKSNIMTNLPSLFDQLDIEVNLLFRERFTHYHFEEPA